MVNQRLLKQAAKAFGFDAGTLAFISNTSNEVYRFSKNERSYILRLSQKPLPYKDCIQAEIHWIRYLVAKGVRASLPITTEDGQLTAVLNEDEKWYMATAFQMAPGHFFDREPEIWGPSFFRKWGEMMGSIHHLTKAYHPADPGLTRAKWSPAIINNPYLQEGDYSFLLKKLESVEAVISALPKDSASYGLIHNDLHPYNFHIYQGEITVFDFDDCLYGWFALDIGIAAAQAIWLGQPEGTRKSRHEFANLFLHEFLTGYLKQTALDKYWLRQIPLFMDYRNISSFFWWLGDWNGDKSRLTGFQKNAIANGVELIKEGLPFDGCDIVL
ncbi:phosphotransferase enzyme family protein [Paenibacillus sp. CAU 1782]